MEVGLLMKIYSPFAPNLPFNSNPSDTTFHSLSTSRNLGFVRRLDAGLAA